MDSIYHLESSHYDDETDKYTSTDEFFRHDDQAKGRALELLDDGWTVTIKKVELK